MPSLGSGGPGPASNLTWNAAAQRGGATPVAYTLFNTGTTGNLELLPVNGVADTLVVRYYRPVMGFVTDLDFLDIPARYEAALLAEARVILLGQRGPGEKLPLWLERSQRGWAEAIVDDERIA